MSNISGTSLIDKLIRPMPNIMLTTNKISNTMNISALILVGIFFFFLIKEATRGRPTVVVVHRRDHGSTCSLKIAQEG